MIRLSGFTTISIALMSSSAVAQSAYLESSATVFNDSESTPRIEPPALVASASAGYIGVENIPGSLSTNAVNGTADTQSEFGFGSVSGYTSNQLMPIGSRFVSAATNANAVSVSADRLTFSWDDGYDNSQVIQAEFVFEIALPGSDPMNSGFNFDAGTNFQLQSSMRITTVNGSVNPGFNQVNIDQSHLSFTPGVRSDSAEVILSDNATISLNSSLILNAGAFVRANSENPSNDIFSNQIGIFSFYRVYVIVPEGVTITSISLHDYTPPACIADLTADGRLDFFDVSAFLDAFGNMDQRADFTGDGMFDFFDVSEFLDAFSMGCP